MDEKSRHKAILECAKIYNSVALNYNYLFVYLDENGIFNTVEVRFKSSNFTHLVGIAHNNSLSAAEIYKRAVKNKLKISDYVVKKDSISELKLDVLPDLLDFANKIKYIGFYNNAKFALQTELITGNQLASMGYKRDTDNIFYPNTVLKQDCRSLLIKQYRILAIYKKYFKDKDYSNIIMQHRDFDENVYLSVRAKEVSSIDGIDNEIQNPNTANNT